MIKREMKSTIVALRPHICLVNVGLENLNKSEAL